MIPQARIKQRLVFPRMATTQRAGPYETPGVDWYEAGRQAAQQGRPVYANPGVGNEADDWRRGYQAGTE